MTAEELRAIVERDTYDNTETDDVMTSYQAAKLIENTAADRSALLGVLREITGIIRRWDKVVARSGCHLCRLLTTHATDCPGPAHRVTERNLMDAEERHLQAIADRDDMRLERDESIKARWRCTDDLIMVRKGVARVVQSLGLPEVPTWAEIEARAATLPAIRAALHIADGEDGPAVAKAIYARLQEGEAWKGHAERIETKAEALAAERDELAAERNTLRKQVEAEEAASEWVCGACGATNTFEDIA